MPKEIQVDPELCCGCMLCSLICSALQHKSFWPAKAFINIEGDLHEARFSINFEPECERCLACVKICPTGALQGGEDDQATQR
ncbi:MAG: hypothetical protein DRG50_03490 [Deltaproteobacteria bacterium]|nr:MAG: hypothetical protein DRG50_03490 [Deltaproteobacteria bacterium]